MFDKNNEEISFDIDIEVEAEQSKQEKKSSDRNKKERKIETKNIEKIVGRSITGYEMQEKRLVIKLGPRQKMIIDVNGTVEYLDK